LDLFAQIGKLLPDGIRTNLRLAGAGIGQLICPKK
jgi:hypothetical protein